MSRMRHIVGALALLAALVGSIGAGRAAELLMFKEDACPWCMLFEREVGRIYANTPEGKAAPLKRIDIDAIPEAYRHVGKVVYRPTFVLLDDERHVIGRIEGYPGFDFFWLRLGRMLKEMEEHQARKAAHGQATPPKRPAREG